MSAELLSNLNERRPRPHQALPGFEKINRYWDPTNHVYAAKILPGEFYVTTQHELVTTVLGSCVSACIRDRVLGIGGMNHFMLPADVSGSGTWTAGGLPSEATRYGSYAMEQLINEILKAGGQRRNLEVKIFGGGKILRNVTDIGQQNIRFVRNYLHIESLTIVGEDVGDLFPRKVNYYPKTGRAMVKKLRKLNNDTIFTRERSYSESIRETRVSGEIELF